MTDRTRLLTPISADQEATANQNYGSIQENQPEMVDNTKTTLKFLEKVGFSLGHIYNDLCAGVWFSYTLLFMQSILLIPGPQAGALVMLGQVSDAIFTPIIGVLTDKFSTKRKWHIFGTFLVVFSFPLIFAICPMCDTLPSWWRLLYFSTVIIVFQFGWPVVQITHLAMIPELSKTQRDRSDLTASRYSASICSNVIVYIVAWCVLHIHSSYENKISPSDLFKFKDIALILTLIGISMSVLFHFSLSLSNYEFRRRLTRDQRNQSLPQARDTESLIRNESADEPSTSSQQNNDDDDKIMKAANANAVVIARKNFFKTPLLYQNALLYVFSRLFMTTSLVYMPLWLNERAYVPTNTSNVDFVEPLGEGTNIENIATVPLASFVASFIASMLFKQTDHIVGHKVGYLIGSVISFCGCAWVALAATPTSSVYELYIVAIFFGSGSSVTMIASLCITADMIGPHADQGGFIYSAVTFCDKLITGIAVVVIETMKCSSHDECPTYYRDILAYACGVSAILGIVTLFTLICTRSTRERADIQERRRLL